LGNKNDKIIVVNDKYNVLTSDWKSKFSNNGCNLKIGGIRVCYIECENVIRHCERIGKELPLDIEKYRQEIEENLTKRFEILFGVDDVNDLVFRCRHCDTIIWGGVDHRFDPHLECPHCKGYKTSLPYWTYDEICLDWDKELDLIAVMEHSEYVEATRKRYSETRLHDWEYWKKDGKKWCAALTVKSVYYSGKYGLTLHLWRRKNDYGKIKEIIIPLSPEAIYDRWIYPHTKKGKSETQLPF
jgi:hypothetical protein